MGLGAWLACCRGVLGYKRLVSMDCLLVLTQIVKTRELLGTKRTGKRAFSRVLTLVSGEVFRTSERHGAPWEPGALEHPAFG